MIPFSRMSFTVSYIVINSVYQDLVLVCVLQEQRKMIAVLQVQELRKNKKKKERERRTADERSRAILRLRRWHSVTKASAELSTNREEDFRRSGSTRLSLVEHTVMANDVNYIYG
jgi:hypothetical protein